MNLKADDKKKKIQFQNHFTPTHHIWEALLCRVSNRSSAPSLHMKYSQLNFSHLKADEI